MLYFFFDYQGLPFKVLLCLSVLLLYKALIIKLDLYINFLPNLQIIFHHTFKSPRRVNDEIFPDQVVTSGHLIIREKFTRGNTYNENWHCTNSVNWTVFYETGCPDSNYHYTSVLNPNYEAFQPRLTLNLVPFGNAEKFHSNNFGYTFACQHGIEELRTNTFQACGRALLPEKSFHSLVMCQMGTGSVPATFRSWEYCCKVNNIDYHTLYNCYADRTEGMNALIKMEQLSANNGHTFIPWFALNGNMNSTVQMMGRSPNTFVALLCAELCPDSQPDICAH